MDSKKAGTLIQEQFKKYIQRFGFYKESLIKTPILNTCKLCIVIPCFNEFELLNSLESLRKNTLTPSHYEVIVVINHGELASTSIKSRNAATLQEALLWIDSRNLSNVHLIEAFNLPKKHAGVGLARKIGMDEAARRFAKINHDGIILCFDADTLCKEDYLNNIIMYFEAFPKHKACSIHFEHPFTTLEKGKQRQAIVNYELHLRYFIEYQRLIGVPHALQTIGSSMAATTAGYLKFGGMNRRKAGEDFYFLHKFIGNQECGELHNDFTIPSCRSSDRVPFGTGKAIGDQLDSDETYSTYHPSSFKLLKEIIDSVTHFYTDDDTSMLTDLNRMFLEQHGFTKELKTIRKHSTSYETFKKHFFNWMDAFMVMKYMHWMRDESFSNLKLEDALLQLKEDHPGLLKAASLEGQLLDLRAAQRARGNH